MKSIRIFLLILIILGIILICTQSIWVPKIVNMILVSEGVYPQTFADYKNAVYTVDGQPVTPDGNAKDAMTTQYFGNDAVGDLNNDGTPDIGFIITQSGGGSGTFYYVVVALKTANGYQGTNAIFLGDRIAPQTTEIKNGQLIVNYADRAKGEAMATAPSVGVSKYLEVIGNTLVVVK